jgi:hypothetical protein
LEALFDTDHSPMVGTEVLLIISLLYGDQAIAGRIQSRDLKTLHYAKAVKHFGVSHVAERHALGDNRPQ